ncbi:hypothetical protein [Xanthomonas translucens]|uniref:P-type conjugative transfer protein n=1 Tax=Xanthomonas translucens pv. translucens DSM 18974 TaxID=1261556 RepID=A0A1C3TNP4_XANCT|nr:hypothetical protein [Xanthomonas translucens]MCC8448589.1 hypothetical protein [Xanthomonas translucens pv. translucens]CCP38674.1 hypothetical protein BN444_00392 [Xanthomonas translucens pv. translucens DSM 18974]SCB04889.1 P-type conjugative transfer protein [Xanthomonas translucens pv. translucens DSM 18974]
MMISKALIAALCFVSAIGGSALTAVVVKNTTTAPECAAVSNGYQDDHFRSRPNTRGPSEGF